MDAAASVFVSYRRDDSKHAAGRLGERLDERFRLFMDVDSIRPGSDFTEVVRNAVDQADVVLALIGNGWLTAESETGGRRIDDPDDWVALEVGTALRSGTPLIPVLVDGAPMPDRDELPDSLASLANRQAIKLTHESFGADCAIHVSVTPRPKPKPPPPAANDNDGDSSTSTEQATVPSTESVPLVPGDVRVMSRLVGQSQPGQAISDVESVCTLPGPYLAPCAPPIPGNRQQSP